MSVFRPGNLVLFHLKPVAVKSVSFDKIEIMFHGGGTKNVREKDIEWLHDGPADVIPPPVLDTPDLSMITELMEDETIPFPDFTELLYSENTPSAAYSAWLLLTENLYFTGSIQDGVRTNPREEVEKKLAAQREKEEQKARYAAMIERLKNRTAAPEDLPYMGEVEQVAFGLSTSSKLMKEIGVEAAPEKAQHLLLQLGVWNYFNNPIPRRNGVDLTDPVFQEPSPDVSYDCPRIDLTGMTSYAIDEGDSNDPDDAISYADGIFWVHIADVSSLIEENSEIDKEARQRGSNLYLPEGTFRMLPAWTTDHLGLGLSETSPALSFALRISEENGDVELDKIVLSRIRVKRYCYGNMSVPLDSPDLAEMQRLMNKFMDFREANGAFFIQLPEVKIKAVPNEPVTIEPIVMAPERELVANAMLATGYAVGKWASQNDIPMPFVLQEPPDSKIPFSRNMNLPDMFALRRSCQPSTVSTLPGRHSGLGLAAYVRVTSPLRRYTDLLAHRQIKRVLSGMPPMDMESMDEILAVSEPAAYARHKVERLSKEYWTLVYMKQQKPGWQADALAVYNMPDGRKVFLLPNIAYEYKTRFGAKLPIGKQVRLELQSVDPVMFQARMRCVSASGSSDETSVEEEPDEDSMLLTDDAPTTGEDFCSEQTE